ncbi:MAG: SO_0444 family Cu/Zn efflux transporter [Pseudomonadota bacterium]
MEIILFELLTNFWLLLTSIAIYILLGVLLAAVFRHFMPDEFIKRHLGGQNFMANIKAAIIGIPLPLCSCSVIPFVSALKKSGASKSAIQTFLIATPITGVDSILATYSVMGWFFTVYRIISSVVISLFAGILSLLFVKEENQSERVKQQSNSTESTTSSCCSSLIAEADIDDKKPKLISFVKDIVTYAFNDIYQDIAKSLLIGIALAALIMTFMPSNLSDYLANNMLLNYILVLLIAMPLYVCATASIPLGMGLLVAGFSPGAVFIFLTAGPATNAITMSVITQALGKKSLVIYLLSVLSGSLFFAFIFDWYFADSLKGIMILSSEQEIIGMVDQLAGIVLLSLSFMYIFKKKKSSATDSCGENCGCED